MEYQHFFEKESWTITYVIACTATKKCAIVDSVLVFDYASGRTSKSHNDIVCQHIKDKGYTVEWILDTHAHADHISGVADLKTRFPEAKYGIGEKITVVQETFKPIFDLDIKTDGSQFDVLFKDGDEFKIGNLPVKVMSTPGHTPACISYYVNNAVCFIGDTLFAPDAGSGRCDFPNGSAHDMWNTLQKLLSLPDDTKLLLCHDYQPGGRELVYETTVAQQKAENIHLKDADEAKYIEFRTTRDKQLSMPKLIIPSIQTNINGGKLPEARDGEKHAHLKVPIDVL
jgi:glyoxylase-like metal-dependent hydrolase (beta-lactamase superfamily II)